MSIFEQYLVAKENFSQAQIKEEKALARYSELESDLTGDVNCNLLNEMEKAKEVHNKQGELFLNAQQIVDELEEEILNFFDDNPQVKSVYVAMRKGKIVFARHGDSFMTSSTE